MPTCERDGHVIHYEIAGPTEAPPLLLIMGLGLSSRAWDRLPARLAERFHVISFDNRGTGRSRHGNGRRRQLLHMRELADDAAAVLRAVGVRPRAVVKGAGEPDGGDDREAGGALVFGVSMGGMIAQELVLRHPEMVRSLVLGATFGSWWRSRRPTQRVVLDLLLASLFPRQAARRLPRVLVSAAFHEARPRELGRWLAGAEHGGVRTMVAQMAAIVRHSTIERLARIEVPTLILTGEADALVPADNSRVLAELIPGARLVLLPGAGHLFPLECEDATVAAIEEHFLGGAGRGRSATEPRGS
ncbi:MAG TPA: alpha/beta fold hydrolase [Polyangia bacterium]|nr:alpha/beta fold hydrolase [Polyangia bacterium]